MLENPTDPIDDLVDRIRSFGQRIALHLMDETFIVSGGNMKVPNEIMAMGIGFEKLESEPSPRRRVAQQKRRAEERSYRRLVDRAVIICASILTR